MTQKNTLRWLDGVEASNPTDWLRWIYTLQIWSYCGITARTNTRKLTALGRNERIFRKCGQGFQVLTQSVSGDGRQGQGVVPHRLILDYLQQHKEECVTEIPAWHTHTRIREVPSYQSLQKRKFVGTLNWWNGGFYRLNCCCWAAWRSRTGRSFKTVFCVVKF